jgi:hypothetical protein
VLARVERVDGDFRMYIRWCADIDEIDVIPVQDLQMIIVDIGVQSMDTLLLLGLSG